jgi:hypothetical protein
MVVFRSLVPRPRVGQDGAVVKDKDGNVVREQDQESRPVAGNGPVCGRCGKPLGDGDSRGWTNPETGGKPRVIDNPPEPKRRTVTLGQDHAVGVRERPTPSSFEIRWVSDDGEGLNATIERSALERTLNRLLQLGRAVRSLFDRDAYKRLPDLLEEDGDEHGYPDPLDEEHSVGRGSFAAFSMDQPLGPAALDRFSGMAALKRKASLAAMLRRYDGNAGLQSAGQLKDLARFDIGTKAKHLPVSVAFLKVPAVGGATHVVSGHAGAAAAPTAMPSAVEANAVNLYAMGSTMTDSHVVAPGTRYGRE